MPEDITDPADLARALKAWRAQYHLTAQQAAEYFGMSVRTINGIEQGRGFTNVKLLTIAMTRYEAA